MKTFDIFKDTIIKHLGKYNDGKPGIFKNTKTGDQIPYNHILNIPENSTKKDEICRLLEKDGVETDMFDKPQQYAHHLNSSQIVCYEFFRPMLNKDRTATDMLRKFLNTFNIEDNGVKLNGIFEYLPDKEEYTNFDFFLGDENGDGIKIFFEIKYTENGFGVCKNDESHIKKFDEIYKPMIEQCGCLNREPSFEEFCRYYQLFRNVLRVTKYNGGNEYSIFLYPQKNEMTEIHFTEFKKRFLTGPLSNHIICIHWEDCLDFMNEKFRQKFFFYVKHEV